MAQTSSAPTTAPPADPRRWIALGVVLLASFMILLDISIVNVAIPSIQRDLGASYAQIQWVLAGYQLGYAVLLITGGRLGDTVGRKTMFIVGVSGFTLASAMCGLAPSPTALISARIAQGVMAALMYPQVLSVIQVGFPPRERGKAFGVFGGVVGVATISGPLLGGFLINADIHLGGNALLWRPIFLVNVPVGIAAVIAASIFLRQSRAPAAPRLDIPGVIVVSAALFMLAYPLVEGRDQGWPAWMFILMGAAVLVFAAFGLYQRRVAAGGGSPLVQPALFKDRAFLVGLLVAAVFFSAIPAFFLTFSIFLQIGLGFSALQAGLTTLPFSFCSAIASAMSIRLAPRLGKNILALGSILLLMGMGAVWLTIQLAGVGLRGYVLIPAFVVCGLGLGSVVAPLINIILGGVHHGDAGSASGVLTTTQQVGGALGVCLIGVIFFGQLSGYADTAFSIVRPQLVADLGHAGLPAGAEQAVVERVHTCFVERAQQSDPSAVPPACDTSHFPQGAVTDAISANATAARGEDFKHGFQLSLGYEVIAFLITLGLVLALPNPEHLSGSRGGGH